MTTMDIRAAERGLVRVFHLDLPAEAVDRFTTQAGTGEYPLQYALGAERLKPGLVDVVSIRDLSSMPFSTYLAEAHNVTGDDFADARPELDALRGHVVVVPSAAFDAYGQTLSVQSPLRWIGTFSEPDTTPKPAPVHPDSAKGRISQDRPGDPLSKGGSPFLRAMMIVIGALILGVLAFAFGIGR